MTTAAELIERAVIAAGHAYGAADNPHLADSDARKWAAVANSLVGAARLQAGLECAICRGAGTVPGPRCDAYTDTRTCTGPTRGEYPDGDAHVHRHPIPCPNPVHTG